MTRNHEMPGRHHRGAGGEHGERGFTLVELMIAIMIGAIVMAGIYTLYDVSAKSYRVQDQAIGALGQLRMGLMQLKTDLRGVAFNAPAQSNAEDWVRLVGIAPGTVLAGIVIEQESSPGPVANPGTNQNVLPQRIRLLGDFLSRQTYKTAGITGNVVSLVWDSAYGDEDDFDRIFSSGNLLRVEFYGVARTEQIIPIASSSFNGGIGPTITLAAAVEGSHGFGAGHEVNALNWIQYRIKQDDRRDSESVKYDLVRESVDASGEVVDNSALIVAEYVVDLQVYDLCFNITEPEQGTMRQIEEGGQHVGIKLRCYDTLQDAAAAQLSMGPGATNSTHLLRALTVKLATRSIHEDPNVPFAPRASRDEPLRAFDLDTTLFGAARVFELASTVFLTGVQARRQ